MKSSCFLSSDVSSNDLNRSTYPDVICLRTASNPELMSSRIELSHCEFVLYDQSLDSLANLDVCVG